MHPLIRILCFLITVIMLARGSQQALLPVLGVSLLLLLVVGSAQVRASVRLAWRMKWLWLSILVVYCWMTPGERLWPAWGSWSPIREGVEQGLYRVLYLLLCLLLAQLVVLSMQPARMLAAVYQLAWPLQLFGDFRTRFAVRFSLTLDVIGRLEQFLRVSGGQQEGGFIQRASRQLSRAWSHALEQAGQAETHQVGIGDTEPVPLYQWLLPVLLVAALWMLSQWQ